MYNNNNNKLLQKLLGGEAGGQLYPFLFYFLLFRGVCIQFPIPPCEEYQVVSGEWNIMAVGKNIKWKKWGWGRISSYRELYTTL